MLFPRNVEIHYTRLHTMDEAENAGNGKIALDTVIGIPVGLISFIGLVLACKYVWRSFKDHERSLRRRPSYQPSKRGRVAIFFATLGQFLRFLWLCCKSPRTLVRPIGHNTTTTQRERGGSVAKSLNSVHVESSRHTPVPQALAMTVMHGRSTSSFSGSTMVEGEQVGTGTEGPPRPAQAYLEPGRGE